MKHKKDFLLEIHTEELPPKSLHRFVEDLSQGIEKGLTEADLDHGEMELFATPRRLAVIVKDLASKQSEQTIERRGPAVSSAFDKNDKPTRACEGFARSCGVSVEKLGKLKTDKDEFLFYKETKPGKTVLDLLPDIVKQAIKSMPIIKPMRWSKHAHEFSRPVHSLILMYGKQVIPCDIFGKQAAKQTRGHRFHRERILTIRSPEKYEQVLKKHGYVIPRFAERRAKILEQINALAVKHGGEVIYDEALLDEVTGIVEWPVALLGRFSKEFLEVPREALISSMQDHQKCFPLADKKGDLLPLFIAVSNLQSLKPSEVVKGNERVMLARLSDAKFFFEADQTQPLVNYREELKAVVFQAQLGTLYDKTERVKNLATRIAEKTESNVKYAEQAAELSKCDLMTSMVGEFPELQGIMGYYYAMHDKLPEEVAVALKEQYMPFNATAPLPKTQTGKILALADRLDTLVGIFGINKKPTGDKDPFALRRAALGVIRLLIAMPEVSLSSLIIHLEKDCYDDGVLTNQKGYQDVISFIFERLKYWLLPQGYTANQFAAVNNVKLVDKEIPDFIARMEAVQAFSDLPEAESLAAANKRVQNILAKENVAENAAIVTVMPNRQLLKEEAEIKLVAAIEEQEKKSFENYTEQLQSLASLREPIDEFFDKVMVMAEDKDLRLNRLRLLSRLQKLFLNVVDISLL